MERPPPNQLRIMPAPDMDADDNESYVEEKTQQYVDEQTQEMEIEQNRGDAGQRASGKRKVDDSAPPRVNRAALDVAAEFYDMASGITQAPKAAKARQGVTAREEGRENAKKILSLLTTEDIQRHVVRALDAAEVFGANGTAPAFKLDKDREVEERAQPANIAQKTQLVAAVDETAQPADGEAVPAVTVYMWDDETFVIRGKQSMRNLRRNAPIVKTKENWKNPTVLLMEQLVVLLNKNLDPPVDVTGMQPDLALAEVLGTTAKSMKTLNLALAESKETVTKLTQRLTKAKAQLEATKTALTASEASVAQATSRVTEADRMAIEAKIKQDYDTRLKELQEKSKANVASTRKQNELEVQNGIVTRDATIRELQSLTAETGRRVANVARTLGMQLDTRQTTRDHLLHVEQFVENTMKQPFNALSPLEAMKQKTLLSLHLVTFATQKKEGDLRVMDNYNLNSTLATCVPFLSALNDESNATTNATLELIEESDNALGTKVTQLRQSKSSLLDALRATRGMCNDLGKRLTDVSGHQRGDRNSSHLANFTGLVSFFGMEHPAATASSIMQASHVAFGNKFGEWYHGTYRSLVNVLMRMCTIAAIEQFNKMDQTAQTSVATVQELMRVAKPCLDATTSVTVPMLLETSATAKRDLVAEQTKVAKLEGDLRSTKTELASAKSQHRTKESTLESQTQELQTCLSNVANIPRVSEKLRVGGVTANVATLVPAVKAVADDVDELKTTADIAVQEKVQLQETIQQVNGNTRILENELVKERQRTAELGGKCLTLQKQAKEAAQRIQQLKAESAVATRSVDVPVAKPKEDVPMEESAQPVVEVKMLDKKDEAVWNTLTRPDLQFVFAITRHRKKKWNKDEIVLLAERMNLTPDALANVLDHPPVAKPRRDALASRGGGGDPPGGNGSSTFTGEEDPDPSFEPEVVFKLPLPKVKTAPGGDPGYDPPDGGGFGVTLPRGKKKGEDEGPRTLYALAAGAPPPPPPPPGGSSVTTVPRPKKDKRITVKGNGDPPDDDPVKLPNPDADEVRDVMSDLLWRVRFLQNLVVKERAMVRLVVGRLHRALTSVLSLMSRVCPETELVIPSYAHASTIYHVIKDGVWTDVPRPVKESFPDTRPSAKLDDTWTPRKPLGGALSDAAALDDASNAPETQELLDKFAADKRDTTDKFKAALQARRKVIMVTTQRNGKTLDAYAEYVDTVMQDCIATGSVDWCSLLSVVEADCANASVVVNAVAIHVDDLATLTQKMRIAEELANENMQQQARMVAQFGMFYIAKSSQEVVGVTELKFINTMSVGEHVHALVEMLNSDDTAPNVLREELLQTNTRLLGAFAMGNHDCHGAIHRLYQQSLTNQRSGAGIPTPIVLDEDVLRMLMDRAPQIMSTKLLHWGSARQDASAWASNMNQWGMKELTSFMTLPQDLYPSVIEMMHVRMSQAYSAPKGLALDVIDGRTLFINGVRRATFTDCPQLGVANFSLLDVDIEAYPLPFDRHTLLAVGLQSFRDAVDAIGEMVNICKDRAFVNDARMELVFVGGDGSIFRPRDYTTPVKISIGRQGGSPVSVSLSVSDAISHADYLVRLRWIRSTRLLREFDILSRQSLPSSRKVLTSVLNAAQSADVLLDLPILEITTANASAHGSGAHKDNGSTEKDVEAMIQSDIAVAKERARNIVATRRPGR